MYMIWKESSKERIQNLEILKISNLRGLISRVKVTEELFVTEVVNWWNMKTSWDFSVFGDF